MGSIARMLWGANMCDSMRRFLARSERERVLKMFVILKLEKISYQFDLVKPVEWP